MSEYICFYSIRGKMAQDYYLFRESPGTVSGIRFSNEYQFVIIEKHEESI